MKPLDLTGKRYGLLTVKRKAPDVIVGSKKIHKRAWYCDCDCGTKNFISTTDKLRLSNQKYKSCGCLSKANQYSINRNRFEKFSDYAIFYTSKNEPFYVDIDDIDLVSQFTWYLDENGYVVTNSTNYCYFLLHRLIMNPPDNKDVDHKNHNKQDNRKSNLRVVFEYQNLENQKISKNNVSGITGVSWDKNRKKWIAKICKQNKNIWLGAFSNVKDAIKARKEAEEKYFGEYSYDNSMEGENNWK